MPDNNNDSRILAQTKKWVNSVIIGHNYCPFAKREEDKGTVRYRIIHETEYKSL